MTSKAARCFEPTVTARVQTRKERARWPRKYILNTEVSKGTLDIVAIMDLCPFLTTFTFNADWYLSNPENHPPSDVVALVNRPHQNITQIGCHGLLDAFGVGYGTSKVCTYLIQRTNEKNMAALTKANFPNLKKVRVLSKPLLRKLKKNDGPEQECLQR